MHNKTTSIYFFLYALISLLGCQTNLKGPSGDAPQLSAQDLLYVSSFVRRPDFETEHANVARIVIPASNESPKRVVIARRLYENTAPVYVELSKSKEGGLDFGLPDSETIYYIYAIPSSTHEGQFSIIASKRDPSMGGPIDFLSWSYLGGALSQEGAQSIEFAPCTKMGDLVFVQQSQKISSIYFTNVPPAPVEFSPNVPRGASSILMQLEVSVKPFLVYEAAAELKTILPSGQTTSEQKLVLKGLPTGTDGVATGSVSVSGWLSLYENRSLSLFSPALSGVDVISRPAEVSAQVLAWREDLAVWP